MPVYEYTAYDCNGKKTEGIIDADSSRDARGKLRSSNIFPVTLTEMAKEAKKSDNKTVLLGTGVSGADIAVFTRQLSALIKSGFPLVTAIHTMMGQTRKPSFKKILSRLKDSIQKGESFSDAVAAFPKFFSPVYVNMVKAGENSGTLSIVLEKLADITAKQQEMNNKIKSALAYPVLMTIICIGVLFFLLTGIVPDIVSIFEDMDSTLPLITRILIQTSDFLKQWWLPGLFIAGTAFFSIIALKKRPGVRIFLHTLFLKTPIVGSLVQKIAIARFSRTLASLLENGVPLLASLGIVKNVTGNAVLEKAVEDASCEVEKGNELGRELKKHAFFPYLAGEMITVGEQSGNLELMLKETADIYENEVESAITGLTSLLEPLIILFMGVVVALIVLAICLPIFEINQLIE